MIYKLCANFFMIRIITFLSLAIVAIMLNAQPLLVGHRGSYWGVENTSEAFINGAKKGYHYLECDVKVAGDGTLVLSHDDTTERLGGSRTIASSTIAQLKAETYTQTRGGVTYTGTICTLAEYLDICKEYNVLPVIELKWATGINSNDCSKIPTLIKVIEDKGFRNSCVILTSMKPCLEYINEKYPDISLQFLTGQYWANHFDWCVERGIDVDIQVGYFDKSTVQKFHDAGLKVNIWTANTNAHYETYGNYGCDFITTDYLDPANLPQLDNDVLFPPNTVDYPNVDAIVRGYYETELVDKTDIPDKIKGHSIKRAFVKDAQWYILSHDENKIAHISVVAPETGEILKEIKTEGLSIQDIAFTADGILLGCNSVNVKKDGNGDVWNIYMWESVDATPAVLYSIVNMSKFNGSDTYLGSSLAVSGRLKDLKVYVSGIDDFDNVNIIGAELIKGSESKTVCVAMDINSAQLSLHNSPFSRDNLVVNNIVGVPSEYKIDWDKKTIMSLSSFPVGLINDEAFGVSFLRYGRKVYAYIANCLTDGTQAEANLYDISGGLNEAEIIAQPAPSSMGDIVTSYMATDIKVEDGLVYLYMYAQGVGMTKYKISVEEEGNTGEVDFVIEPIWENSINKGDKPDNIDGTNAQQGAAYKGMFYVNNCEEERLYYFNNAGCLGYIAGGCGYGVAIDDVGNIIIRNDKSTGVDHSFMIYPAGISANNYAEPTMISVAVPLDGQTNFISASGNVLGERGYIYMFPNKHSAANIITMAYGGVMKAEASDDLMLTGTAVAYIAPINNNSENWLYQVRNSGYYMYNGGDNIEILTGRSGTTAPARNSTGGGALFKLSGRNILLHGSGSNYTGGFTVRDITANSVIASIDPIGNMGYFADGNFSTFNWLFAEKIDAGSYYIYLYCPANGMAVYRLRDKNYVSDGIEDILMDDVVKINVYPNPTIDILNISTMEKMEDIKIFNLMGQSMNFTDVINDGNEAKIDVSHFPNGIYVLTIGNIGQTIKFIKK